MEYSVEEIAGLDVGVGDEFPPIQCSLKATGMNAAAITAAAPTIAAFICVSMANHPAELSCLSQIRYADGGHLGDIRTIVRMRELRPPPCYQGSESSIRPHFVCGQ